jgi:hypothetical protein
MKLNLHNLLWISLFTSITYAQQFTSTLVDAETKETIPFATITSSVYNGVLSNEEGAFSIYVKEVQPTDSLTVSCMGYKTLKLPIDKALPDKIYLTPDIYEVLPVFLESRNLSAEQIIDLVKDNLDKNYDLGFIAAEVFSRNSGGGTIKNFDVTLKKSTIDAINQKLLDDAFKDLTREYIYLNEGLENIVMENYKKGKIAPKKTLFIQSKEELASGEKLQHDFMRIMEENFKSDSQLIIKSGIIRLDKTEPIDSLLVDMKKEAEDAEDGFKEAEGKQYPFKLKRLFINKGSETDFINSPSKYIFTNEGYVFFNNEWVYKLSFKPKNKAKFTGTIYVNMDDFSVVKADYNSVGNVYNKLFNMFGVHANELSYEAKTLFVKEQDKYILKYFQQNFKSEVSIKRPITVIEKNANKKGKKRINRVEVLFNFHTVSHNKSEIVVSNINAIDENTYENFKPNEKVTRTRLNEYDPSFWNGYNILTPEKALQEIKVEE